MKRWLSLERLRSWSNPAGISGRTWRVLKWCITLAILGYLSLRMYQERSELYLAFETLNREGRSWALLALLLLPLNLACETAKWRLAVRSFYPDLRFGRAYAAVLTGLATGIFTPNGVGAYAGRVFSLRVGNRLEAAARTLVDRLSLLVVTLWSGTVSLYLLRRHYPEALRRLGADFLPWIDGLLVLMAFLSLIALPVLLTAGWGSRRFLRSSPQAGGWYRVARSLAGIRPGLLFALLGWGMLRYLTFSTQYALLLYAFGFSGPISLASGMIGAIFLVKSFVPTLSLTELGIREGIAMTLMGAFGVSAAIAISSTFTLYLVNLILPATVGLYFVQRLRV